MQISGEILPLLNWKAELLPICSKKKITGENSNCVWFHCHFHFSHHFFWGNRSGLHLPDVLMTSLVSSLFVLVHAVLCSYAAVMADWTRKTSVHKHTRWEIHWNTTCFTTSMHWLKLFTWLVCSYTLLILLLASWNYHLMRSRSFAVCSASLYFSFVVMFAWSPELLHHAGKAATAMQSLWLDAHG